VLKLLMPYLARFTELTSQAHVVVGLVKIVEDLISPVDWSNNVLEL